MKTVSTWAWQGMPLNAPSPCLCSGPYWVPAQSTSLLATSQRAHLSLVFRNQGFGEEVPGSCGVRMWPGANPDPETGNCRSICNTESHRNWGFLQVHHCCPLFKDWAHADPQEALQKGSNTTPYMTTACVYSRPPHTSQLCFQYKICGFTQPQWHELANELWRLNRRKAVDIVLLPSPVQQNICWGRLRCFHLVTLCGLWATTTKQAKGRPPHGSAQVIFHLGSQKIFTQPHIWSLKKTLLTRRAQWGSQPVFIASLKIPGSFPLFVCEGKMHLSHCSQSQAPSFPQVLRDTLFSISTFPE